MKKTYTPDSNYPMVNDLRTKAKKRIPSFAFGYLDGACNEELNLQRNTGDLREVKFIPDYLSPHTSFHMETEIFGHTYDSPFGIAPIGLQGLMWPDSPRILARAARAYNIPFVLSTVSTCSIENIAEETGGNFWFQLYYPAKDEVRNDIIQRAWDAGCRVLVLLCDTPTFGYRAKEIKAGLSMPPSLNFENIMQVCTKPSWGLATLRNGIPNFETLKPYMGKTLSIKKLGEFMNQTFSGRLTEERIADIRERWKGKLVLKGIVSEQDTERAIRLGIDGIIVSNHGGRQIDIGESAINSLRRVVKYEYKIKIMMDSGIRSGTDVACAIATGASFVFLGRTFMYSVAALGKKGGDHAICILNKQLQQVMEQIGCESVHELKRFLAN